MIAASKSLSEKGRPEEPSAKSWVNDRATDARRKEGGRSMGRVATKRTGENVLWVKSHPPILTSQEAAKEFSAVILDFSAGELAQATGRSKETVKCWKQGRAFPDGINLKALEASFPKIRAWANGRWGIEDSPQRAGTVFAYIEQQMAANTPEGRAMRSRILELAKEKSNA